MVIGLAQMHIAWENKEENKMHIEKYVQKFSEAVAGLNDTALLLFPEMSMTGFSMNTELTADKNDESVEFAKKIADKYKIALGIGWVKKQEVLSENHYSIVDSSGDMISDYVKIHPFSYSGEDRYFQGGDSMALCTIKDFCVGTAICYDLRFPELFQAMSKKTDLIIVPANWPQKRRTHWMTLLSARAIENQCYIAGVNCCGEIGELSYSGDSALYYPDGETVALYDVLTLDFDGVEKGLNQLFIYKIENDVANERFSFPVKNDRREELYKQLY